MQNIGDRLTEARKRLGIALREASEATKIRTDYLQAMENGTFDFSLPEVYKRGFLKIYGRYLKLDGDKLASDFNAQFSGGTSSASHSSTENLGRVDAPAGFGKGNVSVFERAGSDQTERAQQNAEYYRLGAVLLVALVLIVLFVLLLNHIYQSATSTPESKTAAAPPAATAPAAVNTTVPPPSTTPPPAQPAMTQFVFAASADVNLQILQKSDNHSLYNGVLKKDKPLTLASKGPVEVVVSQVQYLTIQVNGGAPQGIAGSDGKRITGPQSFYWPP